MLDFILLCQYLKRIFVGARMSAGGRDFVTSFDLFTACRLAAAFGSQAEIVPHASADPEYLAAMTEDNGKFYFSTGSSRSNKLTEVLLNQLFGDTPCPFAFWWPDAPETRLQDPRRFTGLLNEADAQLIKNGEAAAFILDGQIPIIVELAGVADGEFTKDVGLVVAGRSADRFDRVLCTVFGVSGPGTFGAAKYITSGQLKEAVPDNGVLVAPVQVDVRWSAGDDNLEDIRRVCEVHPLADPITWNG